MVPVAVQEATAFSLFGAVVTGEQIGVAAERDEELVAVRNPPRQKGRVTLPLLA